MESGTLIFEDARGFGEAVGESGGALLGLDLGTKTIGTATCDAGWRFATNGTTIQRGKWGRDRETLAALIQSRSIKGIVLGLPRNMDGSEGPRAQASPRLCPQLRRGLRAAAAAVGRTLVNPSRRSRDDRPGHEPRPARRRD